MLPNAVHQYGGTAKAGAEEVLLLLRVLLLDLQKSQLLAFYRRGTNNSHRRSVFRCSVFSVNYFNPCSIFHCASSEMLKL